MVQEEDWTQHVCEPTRYRTGQRPSLPDLVLTNVSHLVDNIHMCGPLGKSDHMVLDFEYICLLDRQVSYNKVTTQFLQSQFLRPFCTSCQYNSHEWPSRRTVHIHSIGNSPSGSKVRSPQACEDEVNPFFTTPTPLLTGKPCSPICETTIDATP